MEIITRIIGLILLCGGVATAQIVQQNSNGGLSKTASDSAYVNVTGDTMTGQLTTSSSMTAHAGFVGNLTGNAATATKLATARAINGVNFDGSAAINISTTSYLADGVSLALTGATFSAKSSSVTLQGNTFNGASQLVKLDALSKLPAVDGSQLTNLPSTGGGAVLASTQTFTGANTFTGAVTMSSATAGALSYTPLVFSSASATADSFGTPAPGTFANIPYPRLALSAGTYRVKMEGLLFLAETGAGFGFSECMLSTSTVANSGLVGNTAFGSFVENGYVSTSLGKINLTGNYTFTESVTLTINCRFYRWSDAAAISNMTMRGDATYNPTTIWAERIK